MEKKMYEVASGHTVEELAADMERLHKEGYVPIGVALEHQLNVFWVMTLREPSAFDLQYASAYASATDPREMCW